MNEEETVVKDRRRRMKRNRRRRMKRNRRRRMKRNRRRGMKRINRIEIGPEEEKNEEVKRVEDIEKKSGEDPGEGGRKRR